MKHHKDVVLRYLPAGNYVQFLRQQLIVDKNQKTERQILSFPASISGFGTTAFTSHSVGLAGV
jgi:hypothetical protein